MDDIAEQETRNYLQFLLKQMYTDQDFRRLYELLTSYASKTKNLSLCTFPALYTFRLAEKYFQIFHSTILC